MHLAEPVHFAESVHFAKAGASFDPPTFTLLGTLAHGLLGEPSIWSHADGTTYVTFPRCESGLSCANEPVYKTTDFGTTWTRLNDAITGRLAPTGPTPGKNSDTDVTVDAAGVAYVSNLGIKGIDIYKSADAGATWTWVDNVVPAGNWSDRQWMAAADPGHVTVAWMGGVRVDVKTDNEYFQGDLDLTDYVGGRFVAVRTTHNGGTTWTSLQYFGKNIGWIGPVVYDASGTRAFVSFTQGLPGPSPLVSALASPVDQLLVLRSLDGGDSWSIVDTGVLVARRPTDLRWPGVLMAPAVDVTGTGHVVLAWSEDILDPTGSTTAGARGARVRLISSPDWGSTWTAPLQVSGSHAAVMPWVTAGTGDRVAITYYSSDNVIVDTDYEGDWDVVATVVDNVGSGEQTLVETLVQKNIHHGGICARGTLCSTTLSDRSLLDFFEADRLPDGRLMVSYAANPGADTEVRVALQSSGTLL